jgi:endonuclease/exonuclease/phosphatase family metal-dependent hydrolase
MLKRPILLLVLTLSIGFSTAIHAQTPIKVMCYNILNFPEGSMPDRQDTLKKIIDYVAPDLFLIQELRNANGLDLVYNESFAGLPGTYAASTFVPNQSNQGGSFNLQQAIIYNTEVFGLAEERLKTTPVRDINIFKLFLQDENLGNGADTTFLYVFNTHLKSSQGSSNENLRLEMVQVFVDELMNLDPDSYVIFAGDFNVYSSNEPAYQLLLSENNAIVMEDPIDAPGEWSSSSYPFKQILTQSTRSSQIYNDGAGGGVDDRFDFILVSENMKDASSTLRADIASYKALGNNGECYNGNITECADGNELPEEILTSLYFMSDHLPVIMNLETDVTLGTTAQSGVEQNFISVFGDRILVRPELQTALVHVRIYDTFGRLVLEQSCTPGQYLNLSALSEGVYIATAQINEATNTLQRQKFILNR